MATNKYDRHSQRGAGRPNTHHQNPIDELTDLIDDHLTWQTQTPTSRRERRKSSIYLPRTEAPPQSSQSTQVPLQSPQHGAHRPNNMVDNLLEMIDEHLATQLEASQRERPTSSGTMFVDWDGTGTPKITYRKDEDESAPGKKVSFNTALALKPLPPLPVQSKKTNKGKKRKISPSSAALKHYFTSPSGLCATYHPPQPTRPAYASGYDPATHYSYDYNGRIMHVYRDADADADADADTQGSVCSEYYALDADEYSAEIPLVVEPPAKGSVEQRKRARVVGFVTGVLRRLEGWGVMRRLREEGRRGR